jgi:hypothetical protein
MGSLQGVWSSLDLFDVHFSTSITIWCHSQSSVYEYKLFCGSAQERVSRFDSVKMLSLSLMTSILTFD